MVSKLILMNIVPNSRVLVVEKSSKDTIFLDVVEEKNLTLRLKSGRVYVIKVTHEKYYRFVAKMTIDARPLIIYSVKQEKKPTFMGNIMKKFKHIFKHK